MPLIDGKLIGKYKALLKPHGELTAEARELAPKLQALINSHQSLLLSDAEFATEFVHIFGLHRSDIQCGRMRGMPGMIYSILDDWRSGKVTLKLIGRAASPAEMLAAQAEGWRYVTIDAEAALEGHVVEKTRDAFEFALHDLGHAYAFFKRDYDPEGQADFFRALTRDLPRLQPLADADAKFAADLEYLMADMNSHPEHLRQYLRAVITEAFYRPNGLVGQPPKETALRSLLESLDSIVFIPKM